MRFTSSRSQPEDAEERWLASRARYTDGERMTWRVSNAIGLGIVVLRHSRRKTASPTQQFVLDVCSAAAYANARRINAVSSRRATAQAGDAPG